MQFGEILEKARKAKNMTQAKLAEKLNISSETVGKWERSVQVPDPEQMDILEDVLHLSFFCDDDGDQTGRIFSEKGMYSYLRDRLSDGGHPEALKALAYAKEMHQGMMRKGPGSVPYIIHPLTMTCHALAMSLHDDVLLASLLLHDVSEDCGIKPEDLPFSEEVQNIVALVTKPEDHRHYVAEKYFGAIAENPKACMVKCIDRCNNLSGMATGLLYERMKEYISETKKWYPHLLRVIKLQPEYSGAAWLLEYMMKSLLETAEMI